MNVVVALIVFSGLMTVVCVKARAVMPALLSGGLALLLLCSIWNGLPSVIADGSQGVADTGADVVTSVVDNQ